MNSLRFNKKRIRFNYHNTQSKQIYENNDNRISSLKQNVTFLKYSCLFCPKNYKRIINNFSFESKCRFCFNICPLEKFCYKKNILYGNYTCSRRECGFRWLSKVSFTDIILNTPICRPCGRLTKVTQINYKNKQVFFDNISTYVCYQCNISKKITNYGPKEFENDGAAYCDVCNEGLYFRGCFKKIVIVEKASNLDKEKRKEYSNERESKKENLFFPLNNKDKQEENLNCAK